MTREEAIEWIKTDIIRLPNTPAQNAHKEAVNMAIKALEQEPCEDAISREAVREFVQSIQEIKCNHNENGTPINYGTICDLVISGWRLMQLPPVTPKQNDVLDKIRAEIWSMDFDFGDYYDHTNEIIEMVCKVIDKYNVKGSNK